MVTDFVNVAYVTVNQHKPQYPLWNTNDDTCLSFASTNSGKKGTEGRFSSRMSPDFLPQDWMDTYVDSDTMINDMYIMLFRGLTSLVVLL